MSRLQQQPGRMGKTALVLTVASVCSAATVAAAVWYYHGRRRRRHDDNEKGGNCNNKKKKSKSIDDKETTSTLTTQDNVTLETVRARLRQNDDNDGTTNTTTSSTAKAEAAFVAETFLDAVQAARDCKGLKNGDKLFLYAMYKQVLVGNAPPTFVPASWNVMVEHAKYQAWKQLDGMTAAEAATQYITAVQELLVEQHEKNVHKKKKKTRTTTENDDNDSDDDDDEEEEEDLDDAVLSGGMSHTVSLPAVENGGHDDDDDDGNVGGEKSRARAHWSKQQKLEHDLLTAAGKNDVTTLERLLSKRLVHVNHADETGQTALHLAADKGWLQAVKCLIAYGANVHVQDRDGISVLQAAVIAGHAPVVEFLLFAGANPHLPDHDGDTPASCAEDDGTAAIRQLFHLHTPDHQHLHGDASESEYTETDYEQEFHPASHVSSLAPLQEKSNSSVSDGDCSDAKTSTTESGEPTAEQVAQQTTKTTVT